MRLFKQVFLWMLLLLLESGLAWAADENTFENPGDAQIHWGVSPIFYSEPETGVAIGGYVMGYQNSDPALSKVKQNTYDGMLIYTQKDQVICNLDGTKYFQGDRLLMTASGSFADYPSEFFGIGPNTDEDRKEDYTFVEKAFTGSLLYKISSNLYGGPFINYGQYDITERKTGGILATGGINGADGTTVVGAGLKLLLDTRDDNFNPGHGSYLDAQAIAYRRDLGCDEDFSQFEVTFKHFWPLRRTGTFAVMSLLTLSEGSVPFEMLPCLGGDTIMRGYYSGLYRDNDYAAIQGEYRYPMGSRVSGVFFAGIGEIAPEVGDFTVDHLKVAGGFGFRFQLYPKQKLKLRLDTGISETGTCTYLNFMEAF
jgi:hypothetical protein